MQRDWSRPCIELISNEDRTREWVFKVVRPGLPSRKRARLSTVWRLLRKTYGTQADELVQRGFWYWPEERFITKEYAMDIVGYVLNGDMFDMTPPVKPQPEPPAAEPAVSPRREYIVPATADELRDESRQRFVDICLSAFDRNVSLPENCGILEALKAAQLLYQDMTNRGYTHAWASRDADRLYFDVLFRAIATDIKTGLRSIHGHYSNDFLDI